MRAVAIAVAKFQGPTGGMGDACCVGDAALTDRATAESQALPELGHVGPGRAGKPPRPSACTL
jgi:hypothetical protein